MPLIADRNTAFRDTEILSMPVAASVKIFAGGILCLNASGFATPGATAANLTYFGRAEETVDNLAGVDGAKFVQVRRKKAFKWANLDGDLVTQADVGKTVYIVDDQTVARSSGGDTRSPSGKVMGVSTDGVWIE